MRYVKKPKYNTGGQIGSALGSTATSFIPGVGPLLAPIGGMIGGMIGKSLYKEKQPEMPKNIAYANMGYKYGGKVQPMGNGAKKYLGPKHENGGILIDEEGNPTNTNEAIAEVEGGETEQGGYIFSDTLKVPDTDMTFAEAHEMLIAEGAPQEEIEQLAMMQEQMNGGSTEQPMDMMKDGGIYIKPEKRGTFKAQATRMGMGVQEAADKILSAPEGKYSPAMRKKANFARNFAKEYGGILPKYQNGGNPLYRTLESIENPNSRFEAGKRFAESRQTKLPSSNRTFYVNPSGKATTRPASIIIDNMLSKIGRFAAPVAKAASKGLGALSLLIPESDLNAKPLYNTPEEAQKLFGFKSPSDFEPPMLLRRDGQPNVGEQLWRNAVNRDSSSSNVTTNYQPTTVVQESVTQQKRNVAPKPIFKYSGNDMDLTDSQKASINALKNIRLKKGGMLPKYVTGGQSMLERNSNLLQKVEVPTGNIQNGFGANIEPNWRNIGTGMQAATRLGAALFTPRPKALPMTSYNALSTTSPVFEGARRSAGSGFRTAMGTNPQAAYAQYLDATSQIAGQEADYRSQREAINEQMRQATQQKNIELMARNQEARDADTAARMGLVAQAIDIPVSTMARDEAMEKQLMADLLISADRITDPVERQKLLEQRYKMFGLKYGKYGGMIKRADGSYSRRGLWDNIRANRGSGKKPTKQMLEQERKIKAKG